MILFLKPAQDYNVNNKKVSFSFELFQPNSEKHERIIYNGYYFNNESSKNAVNDFFQIAKELSKHTIGEILSDKQLRKEYRINPIVNSDHIERIEKVLKDCYSFPDDKINEFDKQYYEYQISDGKRVIWYKVDNVIHPLFVDCNHMICIDSSRNVKSKMLFSVKSSFSHFTDEELNEEEKKLKDDIEALIDMVEFDEKTSSSVLVDILKESINYKK